MRYLRAGRIVATGRRLSWPRRFPYDRNPATIRFVIDAPDAVRQNPGTASWALFCWNEFSLRQDAASASFLVNDPIEVRNLSDRVDGGVDSYQFCELHLDVRQGNQGNVETILQVRYA